MGVDKISKIKGIELICEDLANGIVKSDMLTDLLLNGIEKNSYYVYVILEKGSICYIGKGINQRVKDHFKLSNRLISQKIAEGRNDYEWKIIKYFDYDEFAALQYEKFLIKKFKAEGRKLYNVAHNDYSLSINKKVKLKHYINLFNQWENKVFPYFICENLNFTIMDSVKCVLDAIKKECKNVKPNLIQYYNGIRLDNLNFYTTVENGNYKVNIC